MNYLLKMAKLVKFEHTIFSMPFIFVAMLVGANGWIGIKLFILVVLEAIFARNFAMGVNRYLDRDIDAKNERTKDRPYVNGEVNENAPKNYEGLDRFEARKKIIHELKEKDILEITSNK